VAIALAGATQVFGGGTTGAGQRSEDVILLHPHVVRLEVFDEFATSASFLSATLVPQAADFTLNC